MSPPSPVGSSSTQPTTSAVAGRPTATTSSATSARTCSSPPPRPTGPRWPRCSRSEEVRTDRLQALADGVFAIALTLLVLGLPTFADSTRLGADLLAHWPAYAAYVVSFVTVAIVWINHHALLDVVRTADRTLL